MADCQDVNASQAALNASKSCGGCSRSTTAELKWTICDT